MQHPQDAVHRIHDDVFHCSTQAPGQLLTEHADKEVEREEGPLAFEKAVRGKDVEVKSEYDARNSVLWKRKLKIAGS